MAETKHAETKTSHDEPKKGEVATELHEVTSALKGDLTKLAGPTATKVITHWQTTLEGLGVKDVATDLGHLKTLVGDKSPDGAKDDGAVSVPQRRAGEHAGLAVRAPRVDHGGDGVEPRPAVVVGERMPGTHFGDVGGGVQIVTLDESPALYASDQRGDGGFAGAGHAHDDDDGGVRVSHGVASASRSCRPRGRRWRARRRRGTGRCRPRRRSRAVLLPSRSRRVRQGRRSRGCGCRCR